MIDARMNVSMHEQYAKMTSKFLNNITLIKPDRCLKWLKNIHRCLMWLKKIHRTLTGMLHFAYILAEMVCHQTSIHANISDDRPTK